MLELPTLNQSQIDNLHLVLSTLKKRHSTPEVQLAFCVMGTAYAERAEVAMGIVTMQHYAEIIEKAFGTKTKRKPKEPPPTPEELADPDIQDSYGQLQETKKSLRQQQLVFNSVLAAKRAKDRREAKQENDPEPSLARPKERIHGTHNLQQSTVAFRNNFSIEALMTLFTKSKGFRRTYDEVRRLDLNFHLKTLNYTVETVEDIATGKKARAPMTHIGPAGSLYTWGTVAFLCQMHVALRMPINRLAASLGIPEFSKSTITGVLARLAEMMGPVYKALAVELANTNYFRIDDTNTKVLTFKESKKADDLSTDINAFFGWNSPYANSDKPKTKVNKTIMIGRADPLDPKTEITFFRTHIGSAGNLLSKILTDHRVNKDPFYLQCDLSTTNLPKGEGIAYILLGCSAHAQRNFKKAAKVDAAAYYFIRGFRLLAILEDIIDAKGRTRANVLKYRQHHGRKIWECMLRGANAVITNVKATKTCMSGDELTAWGSDSDMHRAAHYLINHYPKLTGYLGIPEVEPTNNRCERGLRGEKQMGNSSGFHFNQEGCARYDILETLMAGCCTADLQFEEYARYLEVNKKAYLACPKDFTPARVAAKLREMKRA